MRTYCHQLIALIPKARNPFFLRLVRPHLRLRRTFAHARLLYPHSTDSDPLTCNSLYVTFA